MFISNVAWPAAPVCRPCLSTVVFTDTGTRSLSLCPSARSSRPPIPSVIMHGESGRGRSGQWTRQMYVFYCHRHYHACVLVYKCVITPLYMFSMLDAIFEQTAVGSLSVYCWHGAWRHQPHLYAVPESSWSEVCVANIEMKSILSKKDFTSQVWCYALKC